MNTKEWLEQREIDRCKELGIIPYNVNTLYEALDYIEDLWIRAEECDGCWMNNFPGGKENLRILQEHIAENDKE